MGCWSRERFQLPENCEGLLHDYARPIADPCAVTRMAMWRSADRSVRPGASVVAKGPRSGWFAAVCCSAFSPLNSAAASADFRERPSADLASRGE